MAGIWGKKKAGWEKQRQQLGVTSPTPTSWAPKSNSLPPICMSGMLGSDNKLGKDFKAERSQAAFEWRQIHRVTATPTLRGVKIPKMDFNLIPQEQSSLIPKPTVICECTLL